MRDPQRQIKLHLIEGGRVTVITGQQMFHTTETRRIISRLRRSGMDITSRFVRGIDDTRYKEYFLQK